MMAKVSNPSAWLLLRCRNVAWSNIQTKTETEKLIDETHSIEGSVSCLSPILSYKQKPKDDTSYA